MSILEVKALKKVYTTRFGANQVAGQQEKTRHAEAGGIVQKSRCRVCQKRVQDMVKQNPYTAKDAQEIQTGISCRHKKHSLLCHRHVPKGI